MVSSLKGIFAISGTAFDVIYEWLNSLLDSSFAPRTQAAFGNKFFAIMLDPCSSCA